MALAAGAAVPAVPVPVPWWRALKSWPDRHTLQQSLVEVRAVSSGPLLLWPDHHSAAAEVLHGALAWAC